MYDRLSRTVNQNMYNFANHLTFWLLVSFSFFLRKCDCNLGLRRLVTPYLVSASLPPRPPPDHEIGGGLPHDPPGAGGLRLGEPSSLTRANTRGFLTFSLLNKLQIQL